MLIYGATMECEADVRRVRNEGRTKVAPQRRSRNEALEERLD